MHKNSNVSAFFAFLFLHPSWSFGMSPCLKFFTFFRFLRLRKFQTRWRNREKTSRGRKRERPGNTGDVLTLLTWGDSAVDQSTAVLIIRQPIIDVTALLTWCDRAVDHLTVPLLMCWCCRHDATALAIMGQCHYCWCDCTVDVMQQHCQSCCHIIDSPVTWSTAQSHAQQLFCAIKKSKKASELQDLPCWKEKKSFKFLDIFNFFF
jgi:hypothetical protein